MSDRTQKLKALSDETRLRILDVLKASPKSVSALQAEIRIRQNLLSHHLKILRQANLVQFETAGRSRLYRLSDGVSSKGGRLTMDCCALELFSNPET